MMPVLTKHITKRLIELVDSDYDAIFSNSHAKNGIRTRVDGWMGVTYKMNIKFAANTTSIQQLQYK
jgi:hypothetical protein